MRPHVPTVVNMPKAVMLAAGLLITASAGAGSVQAPGLPAKPVAIPFMLEDGNIVVDVRIGSGPPLPFLFDSGLSNGNLISTPAAALLGLKQQGELKYGDTSGSGHPAHRTTAPSLHIGHADLGSQTFAITDLSKPMSARPGKPPIVGVLGAPLLEGAVLCIDYQHLTMQRWPRKNFSDAGLVSMPMKNLHGLPTAAAIIDGVPAQLVVDTGNNTGISVFPTFADASNLRQRYPDLQIQQATGGSGTSFKILKTVAEEVAVSHDTSLRNVLLTVVPQAVDPAWGIDGLMGYGVLSQLDPCLDRDGQRLMWKAGKH